MAPTSGAPRPAVVTGLSDHLGWAEAVTLSREGGDPAIVDRRRVALIDPGLPSAPYHHEGLEMPLAQVAPIIARTRQSVVDRCRVALDDLRTAFGVDAVVIRESPYETLPDDLSEVFGSYQMTCAADGMLYRETLAAQAAAAALHLLAGS